MRCCAIGLTIASLVVVSAGHTAANPRSRLIVAPVERQEFLRVTSCDSLQAFLSDLATASAVRVNVIAKSRQGRPVSAVRLNAPTQAAGEKRLKVLLFAQQHGDEPSGKEALTMLLARWASGHYGTMLRHLDLCVVPLMNPDGGEMRQRRTSDGIDLNRSHLVLSSPEVAGLHDLFLTWQPEVTLDVHEYGGYSRSWSDSGFIKRGDVQLGMLTNLNSSRALAAYQHSAVYPFIASAMEAAGYTFHEYIVGSPQDRIRHSTTEINDGRQSFGILSTLSFIQEGWNGRTPEEQLERRARSQLTAIEALLRYCSSHAAEIHDLVHAERRSCAEAAGKSFALRMEHVHGSGALRIPVRSIPSGVDSTWNVGPYHDVVRPTATTTIPTAYIVPAALRGVIDLLARHRVTVETVRAERSVRAEALRIDSVGFDVLEEDTLPRPFTTREEAVITLQPGDVIVPVAQWHGFFLPTMLEPESMWGLTKYEAFSRLLQKGRYPVLRIR